MPGPRSRADYALFPFYHFVHLLDSHIPTFSWFPFSHCLWFLYPSGFAFQCLPASLHVHSLLFVSYNTSLSLFTTITPKTFKFHYSIFVCVVTTLLRNEVGEKVIRRHMQPYQGMFNPMEKQELITITRVQILSNGETSHLSSPEGHVETAFGIFISSICQLSRFTNSPSRPALRGMTTQHETEE